MHAKIISFSGAPSARSGKDTAALFLRREIVKSGCEERELGSSPDKRLSCAFSSALRATMEQLTDGKVRALESTSDEGKRAAVPRDAFGATFGELTERVRRAFSWTLEWDKPCSLCAEAKRNTGYPCHARAADPVALAKAARVLLGDGKEKDMATTPSRRDIPGPQEAQKVPRGEVRGEVRAVSEVSVVGESSEADQAGEPRGGEETKIQGCASLAGSTEADKDTAITVPESMTVGRLLQVLGTDVGRAVLHENMWVCAFDFNWRQRGCPYICITDARFPNELMWVKQQASSLSCLVDARLRCGVAAAVGATSTQAHGTNIRERTRMPDGRSTTHASEQALAGLPWSSFDIILNNNLSLEFLRHQVEELLCR